MRNLELDIIKINNLPIESNEIKQIIEVDDTIFVLNDTHVLCVRNDASKILKSDAKAIDWIPVENVLYMSDGSKFECYNLDRDETTEIEVPGGFLVHEWNASQDRVAIVDNNGTLKIILLDSYNSYVTFLGEYSLIQYEDNPFVNVGWGSRNTQFRGSEGKYSQSNEAKDITNADHDYDTSFRIAWRDDGDMFAVSFLRDKQRAFKVFSCECEFLYEGENKIGLCNGLTWKPDGSVIAMAQQISDQNSILFFEKNGLFRFDLKLPSKNVEVKKMEWNSLGDILFVWQHSSEDENCDQLLLYTFSNFKWYLKQNLIYTKSNCLKNVHWFDKRYLEVITSKNRIKYSWKWIVNTDILSDISNLGAIAVIDGKILRITITRKHIIPPPHCSYTIEFDNCLNFVAFGSKPNNVLVVLDDYTIKMFELFESSYTENGTYKLCSDLDTTIPLSLNHFVYEDLHSTLYHINSLMDEMLIIKNEIKVDEIITSSSILYTSQENISDLTPVIKTEDDGFQFGIRTERKLTVFAPGQILIPDFECIMSDNDSIDKGSHITVQFIRDNFHIFSLNNRNFFYNGNKITSDITSYLFCSGYLFLTTSGNKLLCLRLNGKDLERLKANNLSQIYSRSIPNGALLIKVIPNTRKVVFQVPRGEFETINIRILAIDEIDSLLNSKKHLAAYSIMRTDRINPNLLYDINPTRFLNDIEDFVRNIHNCEYIDVFLTQLQDKNVTEELYRNCFEEVLPIQTSASKIFTIANTFIEAMKKLDLNYYLQSIITAYLCKNTNDDLEKALEELVAAKQREESGIKLRTTVDSTLEHMILLSSVESIYDVALGMDNLELIMWIASKSQFDPLQYIPFLHELTNMNENYRKYKINLHIKRLEKAFMYLIQCDNVSEELNSFVTKNKFFKLILKYVKPTNQWYKSLIQLYAEYLQEQCEYKESGIIFMRIGDYSSALKNFVTSGCMLETLNCLKCLHSDVNQTLSILQQLATKLIMNQFYKDASYIYDVHLNNYEEAISVLMKGKLWLDAQHLSLKYNRKDIIETNLKPAVLSFAEDLSSTLASLEQEFNSLVTRLATIRTNKINELKQGHMNDLEDLDQEHIDCIARDLDLQSVVSTTHTATTKKSKRSNSTSATSRMRKRLERKVLQIREGSAFENIAIIRRLHLIYTEIQNLASTVEETCTQLFIFPDCYEKAVHLQMTYEVFLELLNRSVNTIWPPALLIPPNPATIESLVYTHNIEHLDIQYRYPPQDIKRNWKKLFSLSQS